MNLAIATYWPNQMPGHLSGKPTRFRERILNTLAQDYPFTAALLEASPEKYKMKPHTIRRDKFNKWVVGKNIHFFEWSAKPYRSTHFKFAPVIACVSTQIIEICWTDADGFLMAIPTIWVDGKWLVGEAEELLALNDGFDSLQSFYAWFNKDFTGKIIHWTDLKY